TNQTQGQPDGVDFGLFWRAWSKLSEKYVDQSKLDNQKMIYGAIEGMTAALGDPYTVFFPPEESKIFQSEIAGNFEGVGMEVGVKDGKLVVVSPIKDSPAEKAGVRAGDFIMMIDGKESFSMPTDKAVKLIRGKAGTNVKLTLVREGAKNPVEITITRATIDLPTVKTTTKTELSGTDGASDGAGLRKDGIFVISLYSFSANSANLFRNALKEFINSGSHKLILDLRGNPGGYLEAAVDMASWFLPSGKVVVREEFGKNREERIYRSKGYNIFSDKLRTVILVDGGSASASEILAGALSENGVAKLVGEKTFGKGSVQELVNITSNTSLKVTIAKWLTPNGHSISEQGIVPDYVVEVMPEDVKNKKDRQMEKAVELLSKEQ
ncbi:MAG: S41 family peptidase, partial [Patescibacteria group bacterium]